MMTGDSIQTTIAVAKEANVICADYKTLSIEGTKGYYTVLEGKDFRQLVGGLARVAYQDNYEYDTADQLPAPSYGAYDYQ